MQDNTLSIIIPAYNEEEAIAGTLKKTIDAINYIKSETSLDEVEVIVVSDGSWDRTAEIVRGFEGVKLIAYEKNRQGIVTSLLMPHKEDYLGVAF